MKLIHNIKPYRITEASTIPAALAKARRGLYAGIVYAKHYSNVYYTDTHIFVYNIQKTRLKRKRDENGAYVVTSKPTAVVHMYKIPKDLIIAMNLSIIQRSRHFTIKTMK